MDEDFMIQLEGFYEDKVRQRVHANQTAGNLEQESVDWYS